MKKNNLNKKMMLGIAMICISLILNVLSAEYPLHNIKFFQGATLGFGAVFLVSGFVRRLKSKI